VYLSFISSSTLLLPKKRGKKETESEIDPDILFFIFDFCPLGEFSRGRDVKQ
jgi:hypothetical protein